MRSLCLSVVFFFFTFNASASQVVTVVGKGENRGYCEPTDDWTINYIKSYAKTLADRQALRECRDKLKGIPMTSLASYTSTCKKQPKLAAGVSYWFHCTVTVQMDCETP